MRSGKCRLKMVVEKSALVIESLNEMKVLLFADLARAVGRSEVNIEVAPDANGESLWRQLTAIYPQLGSYRSHIRMARDCEIIGWNEPLSGAKEVAFLPPFSGG